MMFRLTTGALPGPAAWEVMTPQYRAALLAELTDPAARPPAPGRPKTGSSEGAGAYTDGASTYTGGASAYTGGAGIRWREAAVLILLFPGKKRRFDPGGAGSLQFPLIVRTEDGGVHSGQLALPGGALESGESAEAAALRECSEELGISTGDIRVLRRLTRLPVPPSRYIITPVLASLDSRPLYRPSEHEVQQVLDCPLELLINPAARQTTTREYRGESHTVPCYRLQEHEIWGATAMILAELAALTAPPDQSGGS